MRHNVIEPIAAEWRKFCKADIRWRKYVIIRFFYIYISVCSLNNLPCYHEEMVTLFLFTLCIHFKRWREFPMQFQTKISFMLFEYMTNIPFFVISLRKFRSCKYFVWKCVVTFTRIMRHFRFLLLLSTENRLKHYIEQNMANY